MIKPPLILTLALTDKDSAYFNTLRQKYFPKERNFIDAHLTLFYALPYELTVIDTVKAWCSNQEGFMIEVKEPVSIGKGVAFKLASEELMLMHKSLQVKWFDFLSLQDRHKIWPHITVQNKVTAIEERELLDELKKEFSPFAMPATGLQLWEYLNGPWKFIGRFDFKV